MKVIAFSLWGNDPKYNRGAIRNAEIASELFPDWTCYFYYPSKAAKIIPPAMPELIGRDNVFDFPTEEPGDWRGMFWRFEPIYYSRVDVMISRDCDSRLSLREKEAVDEWLDSDKGFHCMRDHVWHNRPVLGGMWGAKKGFLPNFKELLEGAKKEDRWQTDQDFLNDIIWPLVKDSAMQHDSYYSHLWGGKPFPSPRIDGQFVGEIIDENEQPNKEHRDMLY